MPLGNTHRFFILTFISVSILVLLDSASRRRVDPGPAGLLPMFQSLFFWIVPLGKVTHFAQAPWLIVSILVLLDSASRPHGAPDCHSAWDRVSILVLLDSASRLRSSRPSWPVTIVSILVLLDSASRQESLGLAVCLAVEFQSLFFWIVPLG